MGRDHSLRRSERSAALGASMGDEKGAPPTEFDTLLQALSQSKQDLEVARRQFEMVTDPMLVDHVVFRMWAAEKHLDFLFQLAKHLGLQVENRDWDLGEAE